MAKSHNIVPIVMPAAVDYGAIELKEFIRISTYRSFVITISSLILLFGAYGLIQKVQSASKAAPKMAPIVKMSLEDLPPPNSEEADVAPPPQEIMNTGPAARAGTPIPVPDAQITADMQDFAKLDELSRASAEGGTGEDLGGFSANIDFDQKKVEVVTKEEEPAMDAFIPVEKEPNFDLAKLQKGAVYPDLARKAGVEGRVVIRVLVGTDGKIRKSVIEDSDNTLLNEAALKAVRDYGYVPPAVQNGTPIACWVSIPILFKLR